MNAERLLELYDRVSEAPDAIPRLRRFVLDLAVRGRLVEQDTNEEPVSELLARIEQVRNLRARTKVDRLAFEVGPFRIPASWRWARLAELVEFSAGRTPARNENAYWNTGDYPWVSISDMIDGEVLVDTKETVSELAAERVFRSPPSASGTILMSFKLTIGKIARLGIPAFHNEAIVSIRPYSEEMDAYLFKALPDFARQGNTKGAIKGATLNRESISAIPIPVPPLAEQHRIVAKVNELKALLDRLEAGRAQRETIRDKLTTASFSRLTVPESDARKFKAHADFAIKVLPELTIRPYQIKALRQTILDLAVRGKLVEQDPNDEPVPLSLMRIEEERQNLIAKKVIARHKTLERMGCEEPPFDLPTSWSWARIGEVALFTQYGTSRKGHRVSDGVPVVAMGNIRDGAIVFGGEKKIPKTSEELPALYLKRGDLLYNRTNSAELVGKTGIYEGQDHCRTFASYLIRIRISEASSSSHYINLAMNAPWFRATQIAPLIRKQTGQANVNGTLLKNMLIPLPPKEEQWRIVHKARELLQCCTELEDTLVLGERANSRRLDSLFSMTLKPSTRRACGSCLAPT